MHDILCMSAKDCISVFQGKCQKSSLYVRDQQISHLDPREPCARRCALVVELRPVGAVGDRGQMAR